jgi:succinate--hydroxymethylglutarate CoA-transferase
VLGNGRDFPCAPINSMADVFAHPQVLAREMVQTVDHPTAGNIRLTGHPVKVSLTVLAGCKIFI